MIFNRTDLRRNPNACNDIVTLIGNVTIIETSHFATSNNSALRFRNSKFSSFVCVATSQINFFAFYGSRWFVPIFACRGGPGLAAPRGGGPRGTQKLFFFLCPHGPLRKYFRSVFSARMDHNENIFGAFFLPARTITKIFSKRFFCQYGP